MKKVLQQDWVESERGWGKRPGGCSLHVGPEDRKLFVDKYWDGMPRHIPSEYPMPVGKPREVEVEDELYSKVRNSNNGVWIWHGDLRDNGLTWGK